LSSQEIGASEMVDVDNGPGERLGCFLRHVVTYRQDAVLVSAGELVPVGGFRRALSSAQSHNERADGRG
jgi:hypothetical protein